MNAILYTAAGCTRCKIVKGLMADRGLPFDEKDIHGEGSEDFKRFYRENRRSIFRGPDGIEFPIYAAEGVIRQGIGPVIAHLLAGSGLDGFFRTGILHGEWVDGVDVSGGDPSRSEHLIGCLRHLKQKGLKLELETDGRNAALLGRLLAENLGDRVIMEIRAPKRLCAQVPGQTIDPDEVERAIPLVIGFPQYTFRTSVIPLPRDPQTWSYMTPDEVGEIAFWLKEATGSNKQPYLLRPFHPDEAAGIEIKGLEPLDAMRLLPYRTKARRFQVMTEIEKEKSAARGDEPRRPR